MGGIADRAVVVLAALSVSSLGCAGESDADRIAAAVDSLQAAFRDGDLAAVCAALTDDGRRQVTTLGHKMPHRTPTCTEQLRMIAGPLRKRARAIGEEGATVERVVVHGRRASATVRVADGAHTTIPLVEEDGTWKVDALYGGIPAARQGDHF